ncbi:hypothetical protein VU06_01360 [Desulfobulbus sp. F3]|nr:hypothetical protein [Desulfobulbus sp. F3]
MPLDYWEYFLAIEQDLEKCSRFVDFSNSNYETNSIEFARIIMAASAEVDTVAKELCNLISPQSQAENILKYAGVILVKYPKLIEVEVSIDRYNLKVQPWNGWSTSSSPTWWQGYNKIKHERTTHFNLANLKNAIHSVSGLLLLILYFFKEKNKGESGKISKFDSPKLFNIVDYRPDDGWRDTEILWSYDYYLP